MGAALDHVEQMRCPSAASVENITVPVSRQDLSWSLVIETGQARNKEGADLNLLFGVRGHLGCRRFNTFDQRSASKEREPSACRKKQKP
jgi:hypothetical protein